MNKRVLAYACLILMSASVGAEEIDTLKVVDIEEVTVVATPKETRRLRELPSAVSLLNANRLQASHVTDIKGLTSVVPGLFIPDYGSRLTSAVYIRGIGSRINTPAVGLYVDNVPYVDKSAFDFNQSDVERIDVLRGPQATLYGRNAMGGIIKIHTKSPLNHQGTDINLGAATRGGYNASATHYARPSDKFAFSVGGFYEREDGFFRNAALGDEKMDYSNNAGGRLRALFMPSDSWKLDFTLNYEYSDQGGYPYGEYSAETSEWKKPEYNRESGYYRNLLNAGLGIEYQAEHFTLSAVTGYQWLKDRMFLDQDFTAQDIYTLEQRQNIHTLSEEIVLKSKPDRRWQWTTGVFGFYQDLKTEAPVTFRKEGMGMLNRMLGGVIPGKIEVSMGPAMAMNILPSLAITDTEMPIDGHFKTPQVNAAIFHQSTFRHLFGAEGLSFTVGLRLDYEKMKLEYNSGTSLGYTVGIIGEMMRGGQLMREIEMMPTTPLTVESRYLGALSKDYVQLLPKFALQYDFKGNRGSIYATVSRGYRSGGYNIQNFSELLQTSLRNDMMRQSKEEIMAVVPENYASLVGQHFPDAGENPDARASVEYKPEQTWSYEAGTHLNLCNHRLQLDAALYLMETKDQQISRFADSGLGRETVNAGESRSLGAELSLLAAVTDAFNLNAAYGYTYATFRDYYVGAASAEEVPTDYTGNYVPFVPKHTLNLGADYTFRLNRCPWLDRIVLSANYNAAGRIYWTEDNSVSQSLYGTLNGRLGFHKGGMALNFWVRNALNEDYATFYFESMGNGFMQKSRPVQAGIELRIRL